jgi:hypothetical protein
MHVVNRVKWLRTKRFVTAILAVLSLASMGGLEGEGDVSFVSWLLLACTIGMVANITRHYR